MAFSNSRIPTTTTTIMMDNHQLLNRLQQQTSSSTIPLPPTRGSKTAAAAAAAINNNDRRLLLSPQQVVSMQTTTASHHQNNSTIGGGGGSSSSGNSKSYRNHQRRQSVARLLPDISKLRLLSWLVEASNELVNCNIAIMDGVYAKLNRSQESLLFWNSNQNTRLPNVIASSSSTTTINKPLVPPPTPSVQPVANKLVISQRRKDKQQHLKETKSTKSSKARNHHSLPLTNYDASSMAAVSFISAGSSSLSRRSIRTNNNNLDSDSIITKPSVCYDSQSLLNNRGGTSGNQCDISISTVMPLNNLIISEDLNDNNNNNNNSNHNNNNNNSDSNLSDVESDQEVDDDDVEDDDDDNSSAASSTTSSGIHGGATSSISSSVSSSSSSSTSSRLNNNNNNNKKGFLQKSAKKQQQNQKTKGTSQNNDIVNNNNNNQDLNSNPGRFVSSAEQLSEKIRRTVMEHNYMQNLLVNIIRQHDKQKEILNQQIRRRQMSYDNTSSNNNINRQVPNLLASSSTTFLNQHHQQQQLKIDLADIADSLDDGCLCLCHSEQQHKDRALRCLLLNKNSFNQSINNNNNNNNNFSQNQKSSSSSSAVSGAGAKSLTLPTTREAATAASVSNQLQLRQQQIVAGNNQVPERKVRRLKKLRGGFGGNSNSNELSKEDLIQRLSDKLCENCFETHYWLHGSNNSSSSSNSEQELLLLQPLNQFDNDNNLLLQTSNQFNREQLDQLNTIITKRNATFIKLVQQEVRSIISKSIELIDLIRREIKSPESIKQKQLMHCFSSSIQLLTSVGNYVVPAQDISTFIPEIGQHQTSLFSLPSSDFDHLLFYSSSSSLIGQSVSINGSSSNNHFINNLTASNSTNGNGGIGGNYHLASAPEIPIRRKVANLRSQNKTSSSSLTLNNQVNNSNNNSKTGRRTLPLINKDSSAAVNSISHQDDNKNNDNVDVGSSLDNDGQIKTSSKLRSLASEDNNKTIESSSGASSNNSSASSSIARGAVQQSSLTRAQTSNAILDGKTSHDLSYDAIASLSRQQTEDDMLFQSRPKFWQSSKFNFIKKLLHVKEQRLLRQQSKDRRIYNNKVQNKFRLVMMDLTHFNKSQQLLTTENGVNSLLTSMRNVLEFGLYLTLKLY